MLPAGCAAANSPHATSAASAATGPVALEEEVRPPSAAAPVTPVKQRGDLDSTPVGAAVGTNTRHRGGSANVYGTPQPSHHAVAVPGAGSALGTPATLTSAALAASSVAATEPTTTELAADLTTAAIADSSANRPRHRHGELAGPDRGAVGTDPSLRATRHCSGANVPPPSSLPYGNRGYQRAGRGRIGYEEGVVLGKEIPLLGRVIATLLYAPR